MLLILHFHVLPLTSWVFRASHSADVELGLETHADQWEVGEHRRAGPLNVLVWASLLCLVVADENITSLSPSGMRST